MSILLLGIMVVQTYTYFESASPNERTCYRTFLTHSNIHRRYKKCISESQQLFHNGSLMIVLLSDPTWIKVMVCLIYVLFEIDMFSKVSGGFSARIGCLKLIFRDEYDVQLSHNQIRYVRFRSPALSLLH